MVSAEFNMSDAVSGEQLAERLRNLEVKEGEKDYVYVERDDRKYSAWTDCNFCSDMGSAAILPMFVYRLNQQSGAMGKRAYGGPQGISAT